MNILIIGDGSAGQRHARLLGAKGHHIEIVGPDKASPIQHPPTEAVVIATPPESHKLYLSWYWNKCPILCEGPVTWYPDTSKTWTCLPQSAHMYAANWCFVPQVIALKELCQNEEPIVGRLWFDYDLSKWRQDWDYRTSCYYLSGIDHINHHEAMTAQFLFGRIKSVKGANLQTGKSLGVDALARIFAHEDTSGDILSVITSSWHSTLYQRGIQVVFKNGSSYEVGWTTPTDDYIVNKSYDDMIIAWLKAIKTGKPQGPTLLDGYGAFRALQGEII